MPAFAATHTVVSLALPGYEGPPVSERWGLSFEVLIEKLQETIASVGGPEKYYLVGHDWGAYLCTLYAEDHADEVAARAGLRATTAGDNATTRIVRGDESRHRRGRDADSPWIRVAPPPRPRRG